MCFVWCRLGNSLPLFLLLSCTEIVPNVGESGWSLVLGRRARARRRKLDGFEEIAIDLSEARFWTV
jgi:hypothetical protein